MNKSSTTSNWATELKAVNFAFAEREWRLSEVAKAARREFDLARKQVALLEKGLAEAAADKQLLHDQIAEREAVAAQLVSQLDAAQRAHEAADQSAQERLDQLDKRLVDAAAGTQMLRDQIAECEAAAAQLVAELDSARAAHLAADQSAQERLDQLQKRLADAAVDRKLLRGQLAEREAAAAQLVSRFEAERASHLATDQLAQERLGQLEKQLTDATAERLRLFVSLAERDSTTEQLASLLDDARTAQRASAQSAQEREREYATSLSELQQRHADLKSECAAMTGARDVAIAAENALRVELGQVREDFARALSDAEQQSTLRIEAQNDLAQQLQAISLLNAERSRMEERLRGELAVYADQLQSIRAEQLRRNKLLVFRLAASISGLFGPRSIDAQRQPSEFDLAVVNPGHKAPVDTASDAPASTSPITQPEREHHVVATQTSALSHVHQLIVLRAHAFVEAAYSALLNRRPDPSGLEYYLGRLRADRDKAQILVELAQSDEGRACNRQLAGLRELIDARDSRRQRIRRWILRRPGQDQTLARIEASISSLGDELDMRFEAMDQRLSKLAQSLDGVVINMLGKMGEVDHAIEISNSLMESATATLAQSRVTLTQAQALITQALPAGHPAPETKTTPAGPNESASIDSSDYLPDALSCTLSAEAGGAGLMDSLSHQLAKTSQAKTLSTN